MLGGLRGSAISRSEVCARNVLSCWMWSNREGALGFTGSLTVASSQAWRHQERAEAHLKDFVDGLRVPVRDGVRSHICADMDAPAWAVRRLNSMANRHEVSLSITAAHHCCRPADAPGAESRELQFGVGSRTTSTCSSSSPYFLNGQYLVQLASPEVKGLVARDSRRRRVSSSRIRSVPSSDLLDRGCPRGRRSPEQGGRLDCRTHRRSARRRRVLSRSDAEALSRLGAGWRRRRASHGRRHARTGLEAPNASPTLSPLVD